MYKNFFGYHLVESYHEWKKAHRVDDRKFVSRTIRIVIAIVAALTIWCLPMENWIDGMTIIQKRTLAIFLFATLMWLFEAVPAWTTSVMVVVFLLFKLHVPVALLCRSNHHAVHRWFCPCNRGIKERT